MKLPTRSYSQIVVPESVGDRYNALGVRPNKAGKAGALKRSAALLAAAGLFGAGVGANIDQRSEQSVPTTAVLTDEQYAKQRLEGADYAVGEVRNAQIEAAVNMLGKAIIKNGENAMGSPSYKNISTGKAGKKNNPGWAEIRYETGDKKIPKEVIVYAYLNKNGEVDTKKGFNHLSIDDPKSDKTAYFTSPNYEEVNFTPEAAKQRGQYIDRLDYSGWDVSTLQQGELAEGEPGYPGYYSVSERVSGWYPYSNGGYTLAKLQVADNKAINTAQDALESLGILNR